MGKAIVFKGQNIVSDPNNEMLRMNAMIIDLYKNGNGNDTASINITLQSATKAIISNNGQFSNGDSKVDLEVGQNIISAKVLTGNKAIIQILDAENNLTHITGGSVHTDNSPTFIINLIDIVKSLIDIDTSNSVNLAGDINDLSYLTNISTLSCQMPEASTAFTIDKGISGKMRVNSADFYTLRILGNGHTFSMNTSQVPRNPLSISFTCRNASLNGDVNDLPKTPTGSCSIRFKNNPNGLLRNLPPNVTSWQINTSNMIGGFKDLNNTIDNFNIEGANSITPNGDLDQMTNNALNSLYTNATEIRYIQSRIWSKPIVLILPKVNMSTADLDRLFVDLDKVTGTWVGYSIAIRGMVSDSSLSARNSLINKGATITVYEL